MCIFAICNKKRHYKHYFKNPTTNLAIFSEAISINFSKSTLLLSFGESEMLRTTINGTSSSVNISTPGATEGTSIVDVRFVSRDIVMIFYYNSTANGLGTVVYARYIKLTKSNTLYQSASLGVCPAQATTTSYYSTVNRYCGNPNSLEWYSMRSYNTLSNNTTTLYLAYTYYNPSAGTATLTSSTASQGSVTGGGDILHSTKYDLAVYNCQVAATTNRIVIRVNRTDSSWQNNGAGDYLIIELLVNYLMVIMLCINRVI